MRDILTLAGPGVEAIIDSLDAEANVADDLNSIGVVGSTVETIIAGIDDRNLTLDVVNSRFVGVEGVRRVLAVTLGEDKDRPNPIGANESGFSVRIDNTSTVLVDLPGLFDSTSSLFAASIA